MWGIFKKPVDPLKARERELERELARLKHEVERLAREDPMPAEADRNGVEPAAPAVGPRTSMRPVPPAPPARVTPQESDPAPFPEMDVRKYDVGAAWRRLISHLRGPTANNPRMARMLAAGSIHGLRPLRYERRVARNRFIALFVILLVILWGLGYTYLRNR